ncbi:hypothetical protein PLESTB_000757900 [Pleodorina starrii]|uniref:PAS domain-containing protein n=1 Tax=Pleodorina starrii TaxID=330485 RepID=A0A9W6BKN8_9CHLO|nr:hypothetical protein PLESTB_000757900 [Pleodorina starrii]
MAMSHTRDEGLCFAIKTVLTVSSFMLPGSPKVLAVVHLLFISMLLYTNMKWFRERVTLALWVGMGPAALVGSGLCYMRLRHIKHWVVAKFRNADSGTNSKHIYKFTDAREVEIAARSCRAWVDDEENTLEPEAMALSEQIIKAGMIQLPQDPQMIILYSSFLIDVQGSYQSGYTQLQTAKKHSLGVLERFAIFCRDHEHSQKASGTNNGDTTVDLVSYMEFQRSHRLVVRAHKEALIAIRSFWGLLMRSQVKFNELSKALRRIESTAKTAERAYRGVLVRHASSARILRLYGKFLEGVKFDPWSAEKWYTQADKLEEVAERSKSALQLGGIETLLPQGTGGDRGLAEMEGLAFICINAQGQIVMASPEAHKLLGYSKNELKGRDLGIILPQPFAESHTAYVRQYVQTGVSTTLGKRLEVMVVTKAKQVLAVRLHITKISGLNEDSVFLGVLEALPPSPNDARMWIVGNGTIVAADGALCDWLGYDNADLAGKPLEEFLLDKELVRESVKSWNRTYTAAGGLTRPAGGRHRRMAATNTADSGAMGSLGSSPSMSGGAGGGALFAEPMMALLPPPPATTHGSILLGGTGDVLSAAGPGSQPLILPRAAWRHKFWDQLVFDTIIQPGAVGSVKVHSVTVRRIMMPPSSYSPYHGRLPDPYYHEMMIVADHMGHLLHVTAALAAALGRTVEAIRAGGLAMLMPEPTGLLHKPWLQELSNPQSFGPLSSPNYKLPPYSCRSGRAISLCSYSETHGPGVKQFRMSVVQRLTEGGGSKIHVVSLTPRNLDEALSERRLRLSLDLRGNIIDVDGTTPTELFDIDPRSLPGSSIGQLVDLFSRNDAFDDTFGSLDYSANPGASQPAHLLAALAASQGLDFEAGRGAGAYGGSTQQGAVEGDEDVVTTAARAFQSAFARRLSQALLELAHRSFKNPNCSWRVGVNLPPDAAALAELQQLVAAGVLLPEDVARAPQLIGARTVPAVLKLRLVRRRPHQQHNRDLGGRGGSTDASRGGAAYAPHSSSGAPEFPGFNGNNIAQQQPLRQTNFQSTATFANNDERLVLPVAGAGGLRNSIWQGVSGSGVSPQQVTPPPTAVDMRSPVRTDAAVGIGETGGGMGPVAEATDQSLTTLDTEDRAVLEQLTRAVDASRLLPSTTAAAAATIPTTAAATATATVTTSTTTPASSGGSGTKPMPPPPPPQTSQPGATSAGTLAAAVTAAIERGNNSARVPSSSPPPPQLQQPSPPPALTPPLQPQQPQQQKQHQQPQIQVQQGQPGGQDGSPMLGPLPLVGGGLQRTLSRSTSSKFALGTASQQVPMQPPLPAAAACQGNVRGDSATKTATTAAAGGSRSQTATVAALVEVAPRNLMFEVELWRADLLSGVLEVDDKGKVLRADGVCPLGQAGLVLGATPASIVGSQVSDLIPLPGGSSGGVMALMEAGGGPSDSAVRGALKKRTQRVARLGGTTVVTARHQSDCCPLNLHVTAANRPGLPGSAYLVLRPKEPTGVQPGFLRWLYDNDTSGLMPIAHRLDPLQIVATGGQGSFGSIVGKALHAMSSSANPVGGLAAAVSGAVSLTASINAHALPSLRHVPSNRLTSIALLPAEKASRTGLADAEGDDSWSMNPESPSAFAAPRAMAASLAAAALLPPPVSPPPPPQLVQFLKGLSGEARVTDPQGVLGSSALMSRRSVLKTAGQQLGSVGGGAAAVTAGVEDGVEAPALTPDGNSGANAAMGRPQVKTTKFGGSVTGPDPESVVMDAPSPRIALGRGAEESSAAFLPGAVSPGSVVESQGRRTLLEFSNRPGQTSQATQLLSATDATANTAGSSSDGASGSRDAGDDDGDADEDEDDEGDDDDDDDDEKHSSENEGGESSEIQSGSDVRVGGVRKAAAAATTDGGSGSGGDSAYSPSEAGDGAHSGDMESEAGATAANFSVGKRFKKMYKILMSPLAMQPARALRWRALMVVLLILSAHTITFALLLVKLLHQETAVTDLQSVANACRNVHEIIIKGRVLESMYSGRSYVPELHHGVYLGFREILRLPVRYGLRGIWDDPLLEMTIYYDLQQQQLANVTLNLSDPQLAAAAAAAASAPIDGTNVNTSSFLAVSSKELMGLWDAGNYYLTKTFDLINNGPTYMSEPGTNFTSWSTWRFIRENGPSVIFPAYLRTLDSLVELTIAQSRDIYNLQLIIVCLEAGLLCFVMCVYIWSIAYQYSSKRHDLYGVFLKIPMGVTRSLANMSLKLEATNEDDDSDDDMPLQNFNVGDGGRGGNAAGAMEGEGVLTDGAVKAAAAHAGAAPIGNPQRRRTSFMGVEPASEYNGGGPHGGSVRLSGQDRVHSAGSGGVSAAPTAAADGYFGGLLAMLPWIGRVSSRSASILSGRRKRRLIYSYSLSYQLVAPFILWGAAIVVLNVVGYNHLRGLTAPIAMLNIVNTVVIRFHRVLFFSLDVAASLTAALRIALKPTLIEELAAWRLEYSAMLYGNAVVPNPDDQHFRQATTGVLFGGYATPAHLLYLTGSCLADEAELCQRRGSPYYEATHNGLDVIVKTQFLQVDALVQQPPEASGLNSSEFRFLWTTSEADMEGGLVKMSTMFLNDVLGSYSEVVTQQIIMFVIAWLWAAMFLIFQLRPFVRQAQNEMRRVAELLSQLPPEVDCESMVKAVVLGNQTQQQSQPQQPQQHPPLLRSKWSKGGGGGSGSAFSLGPPGVAAAGGAGTSFRIGRVSDANTTSFTSAVRRKSSVTDALGRSDTKGSD